MTMELGMRAHGLRFNGLRAPRSRLAPISLAMALAFSVTVEAAADADLIGERGVHMVAPGETLIDIARRHDLGFVEARAANPGLDIWIPAPGTLVTLPTRHIVPDLPPGGIVVNLAEQRLYYDQGPGLPILTFPIGIGKQGWQTPLGTTKVVRKRKNPTWTPPASIRAERPDLPKKVPPGPNNPLGNYALDMGWEAIVIHGTNIPAGIGRRVSHGCIRLYPEDIERLFSLVPVGAPVTFIDQPIKLGWSNGALYLEAHPTQSQADEIEAEGHLTPEPAPDIAWRIVEATGENAVLIDWPAVEKAIAERQGIPVRISR